MMYLQLMGVCRPIYHSQFLHSAWFPSEIHSSSSPRPQSAVTSQPGRWSVSPEIGQPGKHGMRKNNKHQQTILTDFHGIHHGILGYRMVPGTKLLAKSRWMFLSPNSGLWFWQSGARRRERQTQATVHASQPNIFRRFRRTWWALVWVMEENIPEKL